MCEFDSHREYQHVAVAQLVEVPILETGDCGFLLTETLTRTIPTSSIRFAILEFGLIKPIQTLKSKIMTSGCNSAVRSLGLGPRSRGFKSYHPDQLRWMWSQGIDLTSLKKTVCPCDATGRHAVVRTRFLWVQIPLRALMLLWRKGRRSRPRI